MLAGNLYITAFTDAVAVVIKAFLIFNKLELFIALPATDPIFVRAIFLVNIEGTFGLNMVFSIHIAVRLTTCGTNSLFLTVSLATEVGSLGTSLLATVLTILVTSVGVLMLSLGAGLLATELTVLVASVVVLVLAGRSGGTNSNSQSTSVIRLKRIGTFSFLTQDDFCLTVGNCLESNLRNKTAFTQTILCRVEGINSQCRTVLVCISLAGRRQSFSIDEILIILAVTSKLFP